MSIMVGNTTSTQSLSKKKLNDALEAAKKIESSNYNQSSENPLSLTDIKQLQIGEENGIFCLQCNDDASLLAVGLGSGGLQLFAMPSLERTRRLHSGSKSGLPVTSVKFYPCTTKNMLYAAGSDGTVSIWDMEVFRCVDSIQEEGNEISAMDFSNDGSCFATTGKDKQIRLYDAETSKLKNVFQGSDLDDLEIDPLASSGGHGCKVFALRFHQEDKNNFVTAGWDHSLKIWDVRVKSVVRTIHGPYVCGDGVDIYGNQILTASWKASESLQLWDFGTGKLINNLPFPSPELKEEFLYCGRFLDSHLVAAAGSGSKDVKIIDTDKLEVLLTVKCDDRPVQAMASHLKSNLIVMGTTSSLIKSGTYS